MSAATTIIFAREDLSIPGAAEHAGSVSHQPDFVQALFFDLVGRSKPDVIVLDFSSAPAAGTDTILTIRQRTDIPILIVCDPEQSLLDEYRIAGAAGCIPAPVDMLPAIDIPVVIVVWNYPGMPAEDVERRITFLSERAMSSTNRGPDEFGGPPADALCIEALDPLYAR